MPYDIWHQDGRLQIKCLASDRGAHSQTPVAIMHASVVSRKTVNTALRIAALHDLEVMSAHVLNTYL